ncbi:hypothetical protein FQR65_LT18676 [Abscondita terminalis]|nr:hypothetical protein FQR65_LT18676 [Abscondita terminalis]
MVTLKKSLHLLAAVLFAVMPAFSQADQHVETSQHNELKPIHVDETHDRIMTKFNVQKTCAGSRRIRSASLAGRFIIIFFLLIKRRVSIRLFIADAAGTIEYNEKHYPTNPKPLDFSITKNVAGLLLATFLLFVMFTSLARTYKKGVNALPKGFARALEPLVIYVRDEMAKPNIGDKNKLDAYARQPEAAGKIQTAMIIIGALLEGLASVPLILGKLVSRKDKNSPSNGWLEAKATIESEKNAAKAELKAHVSSLSLDIAEKLLRNQLSDKAAQEQLVEKLLEDVKLN